MAKPNDDIVDDYYASHSTSVAPDKKSEDDAGKKGLKLKIKAKSSVTTTTEEPKAAPATGALLVERPKPKIVVRPVAPKREEAPIKQMPRSVFFGDKNEDAKKDAPVEKVEKKFVEHVAQPRHE